ncbi:alpha/beta hydrolase [Lentilactobacillus senioris]|uniref:alpha/beta hydrolase fold domain-containing protein n=1 Tax=Lentilactobacillus senioris TaxID=931534 RepID=UPI00228282DF|nr:alpha/beta hydrolase [Lentilactobacillus senioris]MCY9805986.1 alpha/beta hydrolase [Lentilactobacillus senioris]
MTVKSKLDVVYDESNHLALDYYWDPSITNKGVLIDIHGGGWFRGDKSKDADWATRLVGEGYFVIVPNYRLTPQGYYPDPLTDMDNVVAWVRDHAAQLDYDAAKIGAVGSSVGGNMTIELAIKYGIPAVSLSGILDIDSWLSTHLEVVAQQDARQNFNGASSEINQAGANDSFYKWFVLNYFHDSDDHRLWQRATPYHRVDEKTGPIFMANSLNEFVPTSGVTTMITTLNKFQVPSESHFISGTEHAKGYLDEVFDQSVLFLNKFVAHDGLQAKSVDNQAD